MQPDVFSLGHHYEVLGPIVQLVPVDVVDSLVWTQLSAQRVRGDETVLEAISASDANQPISELTDEYAALPVVGVGVTKRGIGTGSGTVPAHLLAYEGRSASLADELKVRTANALHRSQVYHLDGEG